MLENVQWGTVAGWVSGIGSFSAALVALYIAYDAKKIRLVGHAGLRTIVGAGGPTVEVFSVSATNISQRPTKITNIAISMGLFYWRRYGIITFMQGPYSNGIPMELTDGVSGTWCVDLGDEEEWIRDLAEKFEMGLVEAFTLRFYVHTSNGGTTKLVPGRAFRKSLIKHIRAVQAHG